MISSEEYRTKAIQHLKAAQQTDDARHKAEFIDLALLYLHLSGMTEKNSTTDVVSAAMVPRSPTH